MSVKLSVCDGWVYSQVNDRNRVAKIGSIKTKGLPLRSWFILFCVFLAHCEEGVEPISEEEMYPDRVYVKKGIYLKLENIQNSYALQDTISGRMILVNEYNSDGLDFFVANSPPIGRFLIFDQNDHCIYGYPTVIGGAEFSTTLLPDDTLTVNIRWSQKADGLEVYTGSYKFSGVFWGNELLAEKELVKWIEITEEGDPISSVALRHYEVEDSVKISFIVRNRISATQVFDLKDDYPFSYFLVSSISDTVMHTKFDQIPNFEGQLILNPQSDTRIYCFEISKSDPELAGFNSLYYLTFLIQCEEREIKARSGLIYIP